MIQPVQQSQIVKLTSISRSNQPQQKVSFGNAKIAFTPLGDVSRGIRQTAVESIGKAISKTLNEFENYIPNIENVKNINFDPTKIMLDLKKVFAKGTEGLDGILEVGYSDSLPGIFSLKFIGKGKEVFEGQVPVMDVLKKDKNGDLNYTALIEGVNARVVAKPAKNPGYYGFPAEIRGFDGEVNL